MEPGEQVTGTRDEHYNLISVLYHALHGAENCEIYATDAEAAGRAELAELFREGQEIQRELAQRAKGLLGIEGAGGAILDVDGYPPETSISEEAPMMPDVPSTPATTVPLPDEDLVAETAGVPPDAQAEDPRSAVPPDAPRTEEPPSRTGDSPPSPSEQPPR